MERNFVKVLINGISSLINEEMIIFLYQV